jgi:hypothetical protein
MRGSVLKCMSQPILLMYNRAIRRILGICLLFALLTPYSSDAGPVLPSSFSHRLSRTELTKAMPEAPIVDSFWDRDNRGKDHKVLVFAPVDFVGFPAIAQAHLANDSLDHMDFYVIYHEHKGVKPFMPYGKMNFAKATLDDFVRLRNAMSKIYGDPSVMAETFFEYMPAKGKPYVVGNYKETAVLLSVTPESPTRK